MAEEIASRLSRLGIEIPAPPAPVANYVPYVIGGPLVFVAGQGPIVDGEIVHRGLLGREVDLEQGKAAARLCGLNVLAQVKAACDGDLNRVRRCVRLGVFVASAEGFSEQPAVANGASDLMHDVFGDAGRHARTAIGTNALPFGIAVEVDAIFELG